LPFEEVPHFSDVWELVAPRRRDNDGSPGTIGDLVDQGHGGRIKQMEILSPCEEPFSVVENAIDVEEHETRGFHRVFLV
jgi:hypothetical protein